MTLEDCIDEIIKKFSCNAYFDSHTVINELVRNKKYFCVYLREYGNRNSVENWHSEISKLIGKNGNVCAVEYNGEAMKIATHTIFGEISQNQVWQKKN